MMKEHWFPILLGLVILGVILSEVIPLHHKDMAAAPEGAPVDSTWQAPSLYGDQKLAGNARALVQYGVDLISHTSHYFGPQGTIAAITNGMNCQNCHLDAGTRPWGSNFGGVYATYPQFRARSGSLQTIADRVNDCFERSLNGKAIDTTSHEMQAIYAYLKWLGQGVPKGQKPEGSGIPKLPLLDRAADPQKGKIVYLSKCQSCHGDHGQGVLNGDGKEYSFPPLWGNHSYNDGAGMYRISSLAGFVKNNMPFNQTTHTNPALSDEEAWDVAAYVDSQPRPHRDQRGDWRDLSKKPFDFPFGPYADGFSEYRHKFGPFKAIIEADKKLIHH